MGTNNESGVKAASSNFGGLGWLLIIYMALSFFIGSLGASVQNVTAGIFEGMYGWSQAFVISLSSIGGWVGVAFIFIFGIFMTRGKLNIRLTILASGIILGCCYIIMGNTNKLALYAFLFIIYQIIFQVWAMLANESLCNNWFPKKKGVAIGWATMGFPLSPSVGLLLFVAIMGKIGIGKAHVSMGVFAIILGIFGALVFRDYPEKLGRFPDNDKTMTRERAEKELAEGRAMIAKSPWTIKRLLTTKEVWLAFIAAGGVGFFATGSITQVVPRLLQAGYTPDQATGMIAACALIALPGSFLIGFIDSKLGTKKAYIFAMILCIVSSLLYAIPKPATIWVGLVLIGIALGGSSNFCMSFTTTYFGRYHFQKAFGVTMTIGQMVANAGAIVLAYLGASKGYSFAYHVVAIVSFIMILIILPVKDDFARKYEAKFAAEDGQA